MKKSTELEFSKKLAKYGALSLAIAGVADASGQVVYTDIDPDFYGFADSEYAVDFDGDGQDDAVIFQYSNGNYGLLLTYTSNGGVLTNSVGGYIYNVNVPYGLDIGPASGDFTSSGELCVGPGYMYHEFCGSNPGEGYIGVEFDINGANHYGWVEIEVIGSESYIVKSYAYQATPNTPIAAGDRGTVGVNDEIFKDFKHYLNDNNLTLAAASAIERISIHNMLGQEIISQKASNTHEVVDLSSLQTGVYIVKVSVEGAIKSFKILKK